MNQLEVVEQGLGIALNSKGFTIATAEQCTCGLIGACIASNSTTRSLLKGTITAYDEKAINRWFGVPEYVIEKNGLTSTQVAQQMALETLYKFSVNIAISAVGFIDDLNINVQICIAKMNGGSVNFKYQKFYENGTSRGENIEAVIHESLMGAVKHIMEEQ